MVIKRSNQGNGRRTTEAVYYQLLIATIVAAYLVTSSNCLPATKERQSHPDGKVVLSSVVSEFEDALSRLKQYANSLSQSDRSTDQGDNEDEDPLAESIERESRDEDYRQEPEIVPGLDRFEKNLDEAAGDSGRRAQKSGAISSHDQSSDKDVISDDISLQDLLNFVREAVKDRKKEGESWQNEPIIRSTTKLTTASASGSKSKDISLKDLMEFLKERKNQKNKDHTGQATPDAKPKTAPVKDDNSDVSLKDALEYIASLKQKLNQNERTE
jgi:hypothetical protein